MGQPPAQPRRFNEKFEIKSSINSKSFHGNRDSRIHVLFVFQYQQRMRVGDTVLPSNTSQVENCLSHQVSRIVGITFRDTKKCTDLTCLRIDQFAKPPTAATLSGLV